MTSITSVKLIYNSPDRATCRIRLELGRPLAIISVMIKLEKL